MGIYQEQPLHSEAATESNEPRRETGPGKDRHQVINVAA
jgi:hypothetical protein